MTRIWTLYSSAVAALLVLGIAATQVLAAQGTGCGDASATKSYPPGLNPVAVALDAAAGNGWWTLTCSGVCPPGQTCCIYSTANPAGTQVTESCVCDPTPRQGGIYSDKSGDETSYAGPEAMCQFESVKTKDAQGNWTSGFNCYQIHCPNPCDKEITISYDPAIGGQAKQWCDCPGS